jgi:PAS domain S-box-containing protein
MVEQDDSPASAQVSNDELATAAVRATACLFTGAREERLERALDTLGRATRCLALSVYDFAGNGAPSEIRHQWTIGETDVPHPPLSRLQVDSLADGQHVFIQDDACPYNSACAVVPVRLNGAVVMIVAAYFRKGTWQEDAFVSLLTAFSQNIASALDLPIELKHVRQRIRIDEALVEISHMLVASREIDFEALLTVVGNATGVHSAYFVQLPLDVETLTNVAHLGGERTKVYRWTRSNEFTIEHVDETDLSMGDGAKPVMPGAATNGSSIKTTAVPVLSLGDRLFGYLGFEYEDDNSRWRDEDSRVLGILGDILATFFERKLAERALQESEERWRRLVEHHPEPILLTNGGIIHYVNASATHVLGATEREEIVGASMQDFVSAEYFDAIEERSSRLSSGEMPEPYEHEMIRFDGEERIVESASVPITYEGKRFALTVMRDVTAQRLAEEGYRTFVETITEGICRVDLDRPIGREVLPVLQRKHILEFGYIAECNGIMAQLLSRDRCDIEGQAMADVLPQIRPAILDEFIENGYRLTNRELTSYRRPESPRHFVINAVGTLERGKLTRIWGSCIEVTERVELERRIVGALEEQQQEIGRDLHDGVGQLLTGVRMLTQNLVERFEHEDHPALDVAMKVARFAEEATRHVRDIYRGLTPAQLYHEGITATLAELAHTIDSLPNVHCEFRHDAGLDIENRDVKLHLFRIAQEAVNNALKHAKAGHIAISLRSEGEQTVLRVEDNGVGLHMPSEQKGTSIGLDSMRYRAGAIGGTLSVDCGEEHGTIIECRFTYRR